MTFPEFVFDQLEKIKDSITKETFYSYKATVTKLQRFRKVIAFSDITEEFIYAYRKWMLENGNNENTASKSLRSLRTFVNLAVRYNFMASNPFQYIRIKKVNGKRDFLSKEEFNYLFEAHSNGELKGVEAEVLRYFLFSCTTGLRYSDIKCIKPDDIENGIMRINMHKTGLPVTIPISTKAQGLIKDGWFRVYCNKVTNRNLKAIKQKLGIEKEITFHVARHTFATISITLGIPIEVVSKLLGHTDIKTTQIYAKIVDSVKIKEMTKWNF